jgi:AMP nucleosidase
MPSATFDGITMINFGMGSANAATMMDLLSAAKPQAVLFLGKCGGLKKQEPAGRPGAADRGDPRRGHLERLPAPEVPALPAFACSARCRP